MKPASGPAARADRGLTGLLRSLVGAMMLAAIVINFANVIARYILLRPFPWAEESMQFLDVWMVMLGAAVITRNGEHLRMDALYHFAPAALRRVLDAFSALLAVAISLYVVVQSVQVVQLLTRTGQRSVIARIPMNLMYTSVLLGFGLGAFFLILAWLRRRDPVNDDAEGDR